MNTKKMWLVLALPFLILTAACSDNGITSPTQNNQPPQNPIPSNPALRHMKVTVQRVNASTIRVFITGNIRLGMERQPDNGDSLAGGQLTLVDYSCSNSPGYTSVSYANGSPENDDNVTTFREVNVGGCEDIKLAINVETFNYVRYRQGDRVRHTLTYTDLEPGSLRKEGSFIVGKRNMLPPAN